MKKTVTIIMLILLAFSSKAQETLVVRGHFWNLWDTEASDNFQINLLCHMKGNAVIGKYGRVNTIEVDSVISGSFVGFNNEVRQTPFTIPIFPINEASILDLRGNDRQTYNFIIKKIPYTNYYYIDSLKNVFPNEKYQDKLAKYHNDFQQNIDTLINGTSQGKYNILNKQYESNYGDNDFRYIPYVLPLMTTKDTIIAHKRSFWDKIDSLGNMTGGSIPFEEKELFAEFLRNYLIQIMPS